MSKQIWTGERLETFIFNENTIEHLHRYAVAKTVVSGKVVLDIASGEGYGSNLLAQSAAKVIGVDISELDIQRAILKYNKTINLEFLVGSATVIPVQDASVDVVVSFETIEHIIDHDQFLKEIKRVLKKGGLLIMSTPDKAEYSDKTGFHNSFHLKELYTKDFEILIDGYFTNSILLKQKIHSGSILYKSNLNFDFVFSGNYLEVNHNDNLGFMYDVIFASDENLPEINSSFFEDKSVINQLIKESNQLILNSFSYRLGNLLLKPFSMLKSFLKN